MPTLPAVIVTLLLPFEHLFDPRTWRKAQLLAMGAILSPGKRTVSSHEQKSQLEPQANRLWAHAGQNGIKLDQVVSEVASGLNDRRPKLRRLLADPKVGYDPGRAPGPAGEVRCGHGGCHVAGSGRGTASD